MPLIPLAAHSVNSVCFRRTGTLSLKTCTREEIRKQAVAEVKRAFVDGRDEVLAASEKKCRELEAKVAALESAAITQSQALDDERARRAAADERFATLDSEVKEERVALVKERAELNVAQKALGKDKAALKKDQNELKAD
ncbi:hypothetical protein C8R46DRAFT_1026859 [Mycena filopes]|nr:hypothetical protein C8R46DRAFT_1026859 [Mycena filopes]